MIVHEKLLSPKALFVSKLSAMKDEAETCLNVVIASCQERFPPRGLLAMKVERIFAALAGMQQLMDCYEKE